MNRLLTFTLLATLLFPSLGAQTTDKEKLMTFAGNIHQFNSIFPQEKVYLQFDNTSYYTGETIWFKAFVVNASNLERAQSKVLYVELLSPDGVLLKRQKLKVVAGQADGSFPLVDGSTAQARDLRGVLGYPSGFYEVRAYTNFMQNFSDETLFSRVLAVYDKPKEEGHYYDESPVITIRQTEMKQKRPETPRQRKINASFHPEGGHIIIGQPCRVAFKVTDENGLGTDAQGVLEGSQITFSTQHDGMGIFEFTPTKRNNSVEFTVEGSSRSFSLPDAETDGCAMRAMVTDENLQITVNPSQSFMSTQLGLTLTCRGELMDFTTVEMDQESVSHVFDLSSQPEGVFRLTLFTTTGDILATRSFYHRSQTQVTPSLQVQTDKSQYAPFEKVSLTFNLTDAKGVPFRDRFCLAVRDSRGQGNVFRDDLRTSLLLSSDLKGFIENPSYYFDPQNQDRDSMLDLLCMVQGWERYDWKTMAGIDSFQEKHRLEKSLTLNGWVMSPSGKEPLEGVSVNAALIPQDKKLLETYTYQTDESGYFGFDIGVDFYDRGKFTISADPKRDRWIGTSARILFERSISPQIRAFQPGEMVFNSLSAQKKTTGTASSSSAKKDDGLPTVINIETGYILPDVEINEHRKYVDYYTFKAYDVLKDVELDLDKGDYTTDVLGYLQDKGYLVYMTMGEDGSDSIESINGFEPFFYVHNASKLKYNGVFESPHRIDTKDIKSILIYDHPLFKREAWMLAPLYMEHMTHTLTNLEGSPEEYDRVFMVDILVKEDFDLSTRKDLYKINKRITSVEGYSNPYSFYSPEYPDGPIPGDVDYRRTLYWEPNVLTDSIGKATVEFYNNSITKKFHIEASGITISGTPYTLNQDF